MDQEENGVGPRVIDNRRKLKSASEPVEMTAEQLDLLREQAAADDSTEVDPAPADDRDGHAGVLDEEIAAAPPLDTRMPVLTAFVVVISHDGNVQATADQSLLEKVVMARTPTFLDMYSAAAHIQKDIAGLETAQRVISGLQQQAEAAQQAQLAARIQGQMQQARR